MITLSGVVISGGIRRSDGTLAKVGDTARLFLDSGTWFLAEIISPIVTVGGGSYSYTVQYEGSVIDASDIINGTVKGIKKASCCAPKCGPILPTTGDTAATITQLTTEINNRIAADQLLDAEKQDKLVSGVNIKTINSQSILGSGNLAISVTGGDLVAGPVRSSGGESTIANNALSIAMTSGLQTALNSKETPTGAQAKATAAKNEAIAAIPTTLPPSGGAGGVLSGNYPNPGFAVDMATQSELDAGLAGKANVSHTQTASTITDFATASDARIALQKGNANGIAELDGSGFVPASQLPSYVDDVMEFANFAALPATGTAGKIYVTLDTNLTYRWTGSAYVEISASLALGETSATAYRGDRGKAAYDHSQINSGNPHGTTPADIGAAAAVHTHEIDDVDGLEDELDSKLARNLIIFDGDSIATENYNTAPPSAIGGVPNPEHWIPRIRKSLAEKADVFGFGVPSDKSSDVLARIATTLGAAPDPANYQRKIYALEIGTNDFGSITNADTITNIKAIFTAARSAGFTECWILSPKWVSGSSRSETLSDAILADGTGFYDGFVDFGRSLSGWLTFDNIHPSSTGCEIMARRIIHEMFERKALFPWVGTEGFFSSVRDCLAFYQAYSIAVPEIQVRGHNYFDEDISLTGENAANLAGENLIINITSGSTWYSAKGILDFTDQSTSDILHITGAGTWVHQMPPTGSGLPGTYFGSVSPQVVIVDVAKVRLTDCPSAPFRADYLRWEVPDTETNSTSGETPFYANQGAWRLHMRNAKVRSKGGPILGEFGTSGWDNPIIENCSFVTDSTVPLRKSYGSAGTVNYFGSNFCTDNTLPSGGSDNGTISVYPSAIHPFLRR